MLSRITNALAGIAVLVLDATHGLLTGFLDPARAERQDWLTGEPMFLVRDGMLVSGGDFVTTQEAIALTPNHPAVIHAKRREHVDV